MLHSHHNVYTRWHGSVGRAHRSHRWGRWFESNCHHHSEALVDQGLPLFLPFGITAEGFTFFRVHFGDVNGSSRHFVHTVVWLSCRKIGVALLVELTGFVSFRFCFSLSCVVHYPSVHIDGSISLGSKAKSSTDKSQP